jgi:hypothetical protein
LVEAKQDPVTGRLTGLSDNYVRVHVEQGSRGDKETRRQGDKETGRQGDNLINSIVEATVVEAQCSHVVGSLERIVA